LARRAGRLTFRHFDPTAQALSKAERGHVQDRQDIADLLASGLVTADGARAQFEEIEPLLFRSRLSIPARSGRPSKSSSPCKGE
jgi:hypothetical protein